MANRWEWLNTPSLTHPHLKLEHYNTFHSLILMKYSRKIGEGGSILGPHTVQIFNINGGGCFDEKNLRATV